ncbi:hypothetical protein Dimus_033605 [Dionaea muscipula]
MGASLEEGFDGEDLEQVIVSGQGWFSGPEFKSSWLQILVLMGNYLRAARMAVPDDVAWGGARVALGGAETGAAWHVPEDVVWSNACVACPGSVWLGADDVACPGPAWRRRGMSRISVVWGGVRVACPGPAWRRRGMSRICMAA